MSNSKKTGSKYYTDQVQASDKNSKLVCNPNNPSPAIHKPITYNTHHGIIVVFFKTHQLFTTAKKRVRYRRKYEIITMRTRTK